jgi:hypothetical protein
MDRSVGRRIVVGREVRVTHEGADEVHLEGAARLCPGQRIELIFGSGTPTSSSHRTACVVCWEIFELGTNGPKYRGICRWQ